MEPSSPWFTERWVTFPAAAKFIYHRRVAEEFLFQVTLSGRDVDKGISVRTSGAQINAVPSTQAEGNDKTTTMKHRLILATKRNRVGAPVRGLQPSSATCRSGPYNRVQTSGLGHLDPSQQTNTKWIIWTYIESDASSYESSYFQSKVWIISSSVSDLNCLTLTLNESPTKTKNTVVSLPAVTWTFYTTTTTMKAFIVFLFYFLFSGFKDSDQQREDSHSGESIVRRHAGQRLSQDVQRRAEVTV